MRGDGLALGGRFLDRQLLLQRRELQLRRQQVAAARALSSRAVADTPGSAAMASSLAITSARSCATRAPMSARVSAGGATTGLPIGVVTGAAAQAPRMSASVGSAASTPEASCAARVRTWPARVIQPWTWPGAPSTVAAGNIWFQFVRAPMRPSANRKAWVSCESRVLIMVVVLVISDAMPASWALEVIA